MANPLKKAGKSLARWFGQFQQAYFSKHQRLLDADGLVRLDLRRPESIVREIPLSLIGVGVCQGEAIEIRSWRPDNPFQSLVAEKLQYRSVGLIDKDTVKRLHCLAHRLEQEILSSPQMQDSQKKPILELNACTLLNPDSQFLLKPSEGESCSDDVQQSPNKQIGQAQMPPQSKQLNPKLKTHFLVGKCLQYPCPLLYHNENRLNIESQETK